MNGEYITICGKKLRVLSSKDEACENLQNKQHVFIIGSKGIPAQYGGLETFVDKLVEFCLNVHAYRLGNGAVIVFYLFFVFL